jgi:hypothetical protein
MNKINKICNLYSILLFILIYGIPYANAEVNKENQEYIVTSVECFENANFYCSEEINSGEAFFSETSEANNLLKEFHDTNSDYSIYIFTGRLYLKYEEYKLVSLSDQNLLNYLQPGLPSAYINGSGSDKSYTITNLGLDNLASNVLNDIESKNQDKRILVMFITESFVASPEIDIDNNNFTLSQKVFNRVQKNLFFRHKNLDQNTIARINNNFHYEYLRQLDQIDSPPYAFQRNEWLTNITKDIIATVSSDSEYFDAEPSSKREKAYYYALKNNNYKLSGIYGYDEFKPDGYRYNWNATYNRLISLSDLGINNVENNLSSEGIVCGPNFIYYNTSAAAGVTSIHGNDCSVLSHRKLLSHFSQKAGDKYANQLAETIEECLYLEIQLSKEGKQDMANKLFQQRRNLLLAIVEFAPIGDLSDLYKWANTKIVKNDNSGHYEVQAFSGLSIIGTSSSILYKGSELKNLGINPGGTLGTSADAATAGSSSNTSRINPGSFIKATVVTAMAAIVVDALIASDRANAILDATDELFKTYSLLDEISLYVQIDKPFDFDYTDPYDKEPDYEIVGAPDVDEEYEDFLRLKERYENDPESLDEDELNLYFWLLCKIEQDCRYFDPLKYEWHHIIPQEQRIKEHPLVQLAMNCSKKFLFNGSDNLISLEKYVQKTGKGQHGNHPSYNKWVFQILQDALQQFRDENGGRNPTECEARERLLIIKELLLEKITYDKKITINELGENNLGL